MLGGVFRLAAGQPKLAGWLDGGRLAAVRTAEGGEAYNYALAPSINKHLTYIVFMTGCHRHCGRAFFISSTNSPLISVYLNIKKD